jgi:hypothetical protein
MCRMRYRAQRVPCSRRTPMHRAHEPSATQRLTGRPKDMALAPSERVECPSVLMANWARRHMDTRTAALVGR